MGCSFLHEQKFDIGIILIKMIKISKLIPLVQPLVTEGVQRGSSLVSNYSLPAHAQKAGYCRICKATEKTERFDFDEKLPAHPDVSFP